MQTKEPINTPRFYYNEGYSTGQKDIIYIIEKHVKGLIYHATTDVNEIAINKHYENVLKILTEIKKEGKL